MGGLFSLRATARWILALALATSAVSVRGDADPFAECRASLARVHRNLLLMVWGGEAVPSTYEPAKRILALQKARLTPEAHARFERWYRDHFFMDREDAVTSNAMSASTEIGPTTRFDDLVTSPYFGYRKAREHLFEVSVSDLDLTDLNQAHTYLLTGRHLQINPSWFTRFAANSEETSPEGIGKFRGTTTRFEARDISRARFALTRMTADGETIRSVPLMEVHSVNPYLFFKGQGDGGTQYGDKVYYAPLSEWRTFEDRLSPGLVEKIKALEAKLEVIPGEQLQAALRAERDKQDALVQVAIAKQRVKVQKMVDRGDLPADRFEKEMAAEDRRIRRAYEDDRAAAVDKVFEKHFALNTSPEAKEINREFIQELLKGHWAQLRKELAAAKTREQVIDLVASFHYDFLSLHPYANGNGRMARLLSERLLAEYGIPPPLWTHFGEDVILSKSDFTKLFRDALTLSHEFHKDLELALEKGLPYDSVVIGTVLPGLRPSTLARFDIDPHDFMAWLAASKYYSVDSASVVKSYLRWRDLRNQPEWRFAPVKLATSSHIAEFGTLSPSDQVYHRRMKEGYEDTLLIHSARNRAPPRIQEVLEVFSKGRMTEDPAAALASFNAMMVRSPELAVPWLSRGWFSDPATKAGVLRAYTDLSAAQSHATGGGSYQMDVWFSRPKIASLDAKFFTEMSVAPAERTKGVHLVGGGIEPEAVETVVVTSTKGERLFAAKRLDFRTVEISEFTDGVTVRHTYQWEPGTGWVIRP